MILDSSEHEREIFHVHKAAFFKQESEVLPTGRDGPLKWSQTWSVRSKILCPASIVKIQYDSEVVKESDVDKSVANDTQ